MYTSFQKLKHRTGLAVFYFLFLICSTLYGLDSLLTNNSLLVTTSFPDSSQLSQVTNHAFTVGEEFTYIARLGPVNVGTAVMAIPEIININNVPCYRITSFIQSNNLLSKFIRINDTMESFVDTTGIFPWYYEKHVREGKYRSDRTAFFDHSEGKVYAEKDTITIEPFTQDPLSIFYYIRTQPLAVGQTIYVNSYSEKKFLPMEIKIHRKEKVRVSAGKFECYFIEPLMGKGVTYKPKGKICLWLSTDPRRIIVKMRSDISVGALYFELQSMHGSRNFNASSDKPAD